MSSEHFEATLEDLMDELLVMSRAVDEAIGGAVETLETRDMGEATRVIANDFAIDQKRCDIEEKVLALASNRQLNAGDIRFMAAVLNIVVDLERVGDYAEEIAEISILLGDGPFFDPLLDIARMAQKTREMLHGSISLLVARAPERAKEIAKKDREVNILYRHIQRELLTILIHFPHAIGRVTHLLQVAHNLERMAEKGTNICERAVFAMTGKIEDMSRAEPTIPTGTIVDIANMTRLLHRRITSK